MVKIGSRFAAVTMALALLAMPALSCFIPRQLGNTEERACCGVMGDQCGSKRMPSAKSSTVIDAMILQHSETPEDYLLGHELCMVAMRFGPCAHMVHAGHGGQGGYGGAAGQHSRTDL